MIIRISWLFIKTSESWTVPLAINSPLGADLLSGNYWAIGVDIFHHHTWGGATGI